MAIGFDLYAELRGLLEQLPEGKVTTPRKLACALGDPIVDSVVIKMLEKQEFRSFRKKIVTEPTPSWKVFTNFNSNKPLRKLANKQKILAKRVDLDDQIKDVRKVAGVDAAYSDDKVYAACVIADREFKITESRTAISKIVFPYIPGYLAFREAPIILSVVRKALEFDVLLVNGHGVAHPRGCGLATYVGLKLDVPTIGVARRLLVGDIGTEKNGWAPITLENIIGAKLGKKGRSPVYVSIGHRISLEKSVKVVKDFQVDGGLPEPLRMAHSKAIEMKNSACL